MTTLAAIQVPFNRPTTTPRVARYVTEGLNSGHLSGDGPFTRRCHELLERELGVPAVLLTTSGTHALEMLALLLGIRPGDEVIVPSFTFPSTVNAFALRGARAVFADIRPDTLNIDERLLPELVTDRTRAIVVVHYAGVGCEMDEIMALAARHGLAVLEDNAHGLFGRYRGRLLGTFGPMAAQSFHETKNFSAGEGGALVINDASLIERAEIIREKGTNRRRFFRGLVDKYSWVDSGSSYLPSDLLAAMLLAQLEERDWVQGRRAEIWDAYATAFAGWAKVNDVRLPHVPPHCEQPYHMFHILLPTEEARTRFLSHMRERGVLSVFHYLPLHNSPEGRRLGGRDGQCPVTETVSARLARLPFFTNMSDSDRDLVIEAVTSFRI